MERDPNKKSPYEKFVQNKKKALEDQSTESHKNSPAQALFKPLIKSEPDSNPVEQPEMLDA